MAGGVADLWSGLQQQHLQGRSGGGGGDPGDWLAALPEEDLPVPGRLVADLVVTHAVATRATLAVLLLESGDGFG